MHTCSNPRNGLKQVQPVNEQPTRGLHLATESAEGPKPPEPYLCPMKKRDSGLIFGRHPVEEALQQGRAVEKVFLLQGTRGDFEKKIRRLCREQNIPLQMVPRQKLDRMVRANHQGVVLSLSAIPFYRLEDLLPQVYEKGEAPLLAILDGITDVRNMGAIARSAELCGVHALIISRKGHARLHEDAVKTSAGALLRLPVCRESSILSAVKLLQDSGIRVLAARAEAENVLRDMDLRLPIAFVFGDEGKGISRAVEELCNQAFRIPQKGEGHSFNVSVAAGICFYESMMQRR